MAVLSYQLNRRVTIEQRQSGQDAIGQPLSGWTPVATVWANIRHQGGLETMKAGGELSIVRASIRTRYRTDIDAGMRVLHGGTVYNIKAVLPDVEQKRHVDLVCEVTNGQ